MVTSGRHAADLESTSVAIPALQACKRCYARKRKCDRLQPRCTACVKANAECEMDVKFVDRSIVVQLNELRSGTVELQRRINWLESFIKDAHPTLSAISDMSTGSELASPPISYSRGDEVPAIHSLPSLPTLPSLSSITPMPSHPPLPAINLSTLVSSSLCMRGLGNRPAIHAIGNYRSASQHPRVPPIDTAFHLARTYIAEHKQSYHSVAKDEIEDDIRLVYGEDGLVNPTYAANRFRCFSVLYLRILALRRSGKEEDNEEWAQGCRALALQEMDKVLAQEDTTAVQALALLCLFAVHEPGGPSLWQLVGMAARTVITVGLHRRDEVYLASVMHTIQDETVLKVHNARRKNLFWAIYSLDRLATFSLSQPPALRDCDIDVELPTVTAATPGLGAERSDVALRCHNLQLRKLYGKIHESLYAVNVKADRPFIEREAIVADLVRQIQNWYNSSPLKVAFAPISEATINRQVTDDISYHQMILALHRPSPLIPEIPSTFVLTLKNSASISVDLYQHYWSRNQVLIIWVHLCQLFTSCITLIYCFCEHRSRFDLVEVPAEEVKTRIVQMKDLLARFGPAWPESVRYQAMFDALVNSFESMVPSSQFVSAPVEMAQQASGPAPSAVFDGFHGSDMNASTSQGEVANPFWFLDYASPNTLMRGLWVDTAATNVEPAWR